MDSESIYNTLLPKSICNLNLKRYVRFIEHCRTQDTSQFEETEDHHILPQSIYPEYSNFKEYPWNRVTLSHRQHFIAHWMLARALGGGMSYAFWKMANTNGQKGKGKIVVSSRVYAEAKRRSIEFIKEYWNNPENVKRAMANRQESCIRNRTYEKLSGSHKEYAQTPEGKVDYEERGRKAHETKTKYNIYALAGKKLSAWCNEIDPETGLSNAQVRSSKVDRDVYRENLGMSIRERLSEAMSGDNNPAKRPEVRAKISASITEYYKHNPGSFTGKKHTEEFKRKMSEDRKGDKSPLYNTVWYNNGIENLRLPSDQSPPEGFVKGRIQNYSKKKLKKLTCPHCNKTGGSGNMMRYHFDFCKQKKTSNSVNDTEVSLLDFV